MGRLLKNFVIAVFYIAILSAVGLYYFAKRSITEAESTSISLSPNLVRFSQLTGIPLPKEREDGCTLEPTNQYLVKGFSAMSFNSLVSEARSAEAAAIKFEKSGNKQMLEIATSDAMSRWQQALLARADMNCADILIQRSKY